MEKYNVESIIIIHAYELLLTVDSKITQNMNG